MRKEIIFFVIILFLGACGDGNVVIQKDPNVQFREDSVAIVNYLNQKGYTDFEQSETGVWYFTLEVGSGSTIEENDIVTFDYTGILLNDTIFDTSIESVGDSIRSYFLADSVGLADKSVHELFLLTFSEDRNYNSITRTYTTTGWNLNSGFPYDSDGTPASNRVFNDGFKNGYSLAMEGVAVGSKVILIMASTSGFGTIARGVIPSNSPLVFEVTPTAVIKQ